MMTKTISIAWCLGLILLGPTPAALADDPRLLGCWRTQHSAQYMPDKKTVHLNSDCVLEFGPHQERSECLLKDKPVSQSFDYEIVAPGRYAIISAPTAAGGAAKAAQTRREVEYRIDGDWLTLAVVPPRPATAGARATPDRIESLALRVPAADACHPRGPSSIRATPGPVSSLVLSVPEGFVPVLEDLHRDPHLAASINQNFLIGMFTPRSGSAQASGLRFVLAVEDYKQGPHPVKADDFAQFKTKTRDELQASLGKHSVDAPAGKQNLLGVSCETPNKICFDTEQSPSKGDQGPTTYLTTAFVNVKGRVAIVYGSADAAAPKSLKAAQSAAHLFADRLLADNP